MTLSIPMFPPTADRLRAFSAGLAMQERLRETALYDLTRLRKEARAEIDRLIQFLDQSDTYVMTELEEDDDREEGGDAEPSLGSFDRITDQEKSYRQVSFWCLPSGGDLEQDDCDSEPSLGSSDGWSGEHASQENWASGGRDDREDDPTENGIADRDGLVEQVGSQDWQRGVLA